MTIDLDAIETLANAATPEDWFPETYSSGHRQVCGNLHPVGEDEDAYTVVADVYKREDHEYLIAAQPKAILALVAEVRSLREFHDFFYDRCEGLFAQFGMAGVDSYNATALARRKP